MMNGNSDDSSRNGNGNFNGNGTYYEGDDEQVIIVGIRKKKSSLNNNYNNKTMNKSNNNSSNLFGFCFCGSVSPPPSSSSTNSNCDDNTGNDNNNNSNDLLLVRRISTVHFRQTGVFPPQEIQTLRHDTKLKVREHFELQSQVASLKRYVRTGSKIAVGLQTLEQLEHNNNINNNNNRIGVKTRMGYDDIRAAQQRLNVRLMKMGLSSVRMGDDGNCQVIITTITIIP